MRRTVVNTDWDYSGYLVSDACEKCRTFTLIGPQEAVDAQAVVEAGYRPGFVIAKSYR